MRTFIWFAGILTVFLLAVVAAVFVAPLAGMAVLGVAFIAYAFWEDGVQRKRFLR